MKGYSGMGSSSVARVAAVVLVVMLASVTLVPFDDADADSEKPKMYCYTYGITLFHDLGTNLDSVEWEVTDGNGSPVEWEWVEQSAPLWSIHLDEDDVAAAGTLHVKQTAVRGSTTDVQTQEIVPLADLRGGGFEVTYYDGYTGAAVHTQQFTYQTVVYEGDDFLQVPGAPDRPGHNFLGWFVGPEMKERLDPKEPVTGEMDVYARWDGSSETIVIHDPVYIPTGHLVTFQTADGLEYTVTGTTGTSISFTAGVAEGHVLNGEMYVRCDGLDIPFKDGVYTLSGINSDKVIQIMGDVSPVPGPAPDGDPFPWWIVILFIVILVAAIVLAFVYGRRRGEMAQELAEEQGSGEGQELAEDLEPIEGEELGEVQEPTEDK